MSRSNYSDECDDNLALGRWRGQVNSAIRGKRGQALLIGILAAFDTMPVKALVADSLITADGQFCTLGALGAVRGIDMSNIDPEDYYEVAKAFDIAPALAREIVWYNDEWDYYGKETPEQRFSRMREWVLSKIKEPAHSV